MVRHPFLLALDRYDIVDGRLYITMELADCNLWDRFRVCRKQGLPGIPREELLRYMSETAEVLDLFNDKFQLQHLDIKPQNLFLMHDHVKVADFGQVKDLEGIMAQVTGGITPVYAAPETFDGFVSRFCDQYSLAIVYQELLTGQRPFDGTSMQQLLMQHLQMPPDLAPAPPCDRPALAVALAKKPDARFPNVSAFVRALRAGGELPRPGGGAIGPGAGTSPSERIEVFLTGGQTPTGMPSAHMANSLSTAPPEVRTPAPRSVAETAPPPARPAPPVQTGPGCLRPTLVIGVGYTGLRVVQRFRRQLADRYGPAAATPLIRTLYIDTDPDALAAASAPDQPGTGLAPLAPEDVFPAKLQRPAHYHKPRLNGRTLGDGWFDPQLLYKLPRTPVTLGYRAFGRLAFCDHYRTFVPKVQAELEACLDPDALAATRRATGLDVRTNRPRVYVVAGLGGGTGGGMFLDIAYTVRSRLKRLGYAAPDVVGLLLPPAGPPGDVTAQAQANTYAALTELHHYGRPDSTFVAAYDERAGSIRDGDPPFSQVYLLPGLAAAPVEAAPPAGRSAAVRMAGVQRAATDRTSGVRRTGTERTPPARPSADAPDPTAVAADHLRLHLLTQVGALADAARPARLATADATPVCPTHTFGLAAYTWPRAELVARTGRVLAPVLVRHWVCPDPAQVRQVIPAWAAGQWAAAGLEPAALCDKLTLAAGQALGVDIGREVAGGVDRLAPKGWRGRSPDAAAVAGVLDRWQQLLGRPNTPAGRPQGAFADAVTAAAEDVYEAVRAAHAEMFPALVETPDFRLAGTEEAIRQVLALVEQARVKCDKVAAERTQASAVALDLLLAFVHHQKGMHKPTPAEFADAARAYPHGQVEQVAARTAAKVYRKVKDDLVNILGEISGGRVRVEQCLPELTAAADLPAGPAAAGDLLPPGCGTTEDAAQLFLKSLADDDFHDLETAVQAGLEARFGGLHQACQNATDGIGGLLEILHEQTRAYLDDRLGEVDVAAMLFARYGGPDGTAAELRRAYEAAAPTLIGNGPWSQDGVGVFAGPAGAGGDPVRDLAADALPDGTLDAPSADEVVVYREYPDIPFAALPQLGPQWAAAYQAFPDATPHTRTDVTRWADVDTA